MNENQRRVAVIERRVFTSLASRIPLGTLLTSGAMEVLGDAEAVAIVESPEALPDLPMTQQPKPLIRQLTAHLRKKQMEKHNDEYKYFRTRS